MLTWWYPGSAGKQGFRRHGGWGRREIPTAAAAARERRRRGAWRKVGRHCGPRTNGGSRSCETSYLVGGCGGEREKGWTETVFDSTHTVVLCVVREKGKEGFQEGLGLTTCFKTAPYVLTNVYPVSLVNAIIFKIYIWITVTIKDKINFNPLAC